jgi:enoyl-CoA hydratase/carnithine racemase
MCDIRIGSEEAVFAESFVQIGIVPGSGGAWLLPRIVGIAKASEMAFTGAALDAKEALAVGLISRIAPSSKLMEEAISLAQEIAKNPPLAVRWTKRLIREGQHMPFESLLDMSALYQSLAHTTADHSEAVASKLDRRQASFAGR